jgi:hypothetical protein
MGRGREGGRERERWGREGEGEGGCKVGQQNCVGTFQVPYLEVVVSSFYQDYLGVPVARFCQLRKLVYKLDQLSQSESVKETLTWERTF